MLKKVLNAAILDFWTSKGKLNKLKGDLFYCHVQMAGSSFYFRSPGGHEGGHVQLQWERDVSSDLPP